MSVTLKNFLVMHGKGDYGGAITSQAQSLTIKDCRFLDSLANYGAAIYQKGGELQIMDSTFEGNNATIWGTAIYDEGGDILRSMPYCQDGVKASLLNLHRFVLNSCGPHQEIQILLLIVPKSESYPLAIRT